MVLKTKWKELDDSDIEVDIDYLNSHFGAAPPKVQSRNISLGSSTPSSANLASSGELQPQLITFIDDKKSRSVAIMLTRFRIDITEIFNKIKLMKDDFTDDQLAAVQSNLPSDEEIQQVKNFDGDKKQLGLCERYFAKLIQINGLRYHVELLILERSIDQRIEDLNEPLNKIIGALDEINDSKKLEGVLTVILKIGNIMNGGGSRGAAYGFKIDLLPKIEDIRSSQPGYTMMTFLVQYFDEKKPELLNFNEELKTVLPASKADLKFVQTDYKQLRSTIETLRSHLPQAEKDINDDDNYFNKFVDFESKHKDDIANIETKLNQVDEIYKKTCESYGEEVDKFTCQEFLQTFAKFLIDYEVELQHYKEKKEKEEKAKKAAEEKARIEEANKIRKIRDQEQKHPEQKPIEIQSQRGQLNNMMNTIMGASIQTEDEVQNEDIVKNIESKRAARIRNLLAKKKIKNELT